MNNLSTGKKKSSTKKRILLVVLTLIIVGAVAYLFVPQPDTHKSLFDSLFNKTDQNTVNTPTESPAAISNSPTPSPTTETNTLTIPAWGVKFTIPVSLQDTSVKYTERKSNDQPPVTYYAFTTSRIQALGDKCTTQPFGDTVILNRFSDKPVAVPDGELISENPIGGYYYVVLSPIASCTGFDANGKAQTPSQVETNDRASLNELVKSVQAS